MQGKQCLFDHNSSENSRSSENNEIKKKKRLWRKLKARPSEILNRKFKELRRSVKQLVRSEYKRYLEHLSSQLKLNPKRFWSYHSIKSKSKRLPDVNTYNGRSAIKPHEQATLFNIHFHSVFVNRVLGYQLQYKLTYKIQVLR